MKLRAWVAVFLGLLAGQANALTYTEGTDLGDSNGTATALGDLSVGINTISGTATSTDADFFKVNLLSGHQIASSSFAISSYTGDGSWRADFQSASQDILFANRAFTSTGTFSLSELVNSGVGPEPLFGRIIWEGGGAAGTITYALTINVRELPPDPVPEPSTYALMLAGLGLLGFMARRRKQ